MSLFVNNKVNVACSVNASVMLICEGVSLRQLQWSYNISFNSSERIKLGSPFLPDSRANSTAIGYINNHVFLAAQLVAVFQYADQKAFANFSSILFIDLFKLENQEITSITCGDVSTYEEKLVSDIIVWDLVNTRITAMYWLGALTSVEVHLRSLVSCA